MSDLLHNFHYDEELFNIAYEAAQQEGASVVDSFEKAQDALRNDLRSVKEKQEGLLDAYLAKIVPGDVMRKKWLL